MASSDWRGFYDAVNQAALARYPAILHDWLPGGREYGSEYCTAGLKGGQGQSLRVHIADDSKKGLWAEFEGGGASGRNAIALYAAIHGLPYRDAAAELGERFNLKRPERLRLATSSWVPIVPVPAEVPLTADGLPEVELRDDGSEITGAWPYLDRDGLVTHFRLRIERSGQGKTILPVTWCRNAETGQERWLWKDVPAPRPLYGLELLAGAGPDAPVLVVQGEKTADAARRMLADKHPEWIVVTNPGGDNRVNTKWTDWSPVINHPGPVTIWPDNDESGLKAAVVVALALKASCRVVRPDPAWKQSWDLADAEGEGWTGDQVLAYVAEHSVTSEPPRRNRVLCDISGSDLDDRSQAVWAAVKAANAPPTLFRSTEGLVIAIPELQVLMRANVFSLRHWLTQRIKFQRTAHNDVIPATPPGDLLENLLVYSEAPLPFLRRKVQMPVLTADGRLLSTPGHDEGSGLYYLAPVDLEHFETAATEPSDDEIAGAVALIDDLLCDFPFADDTARAHAFAFALTVIVRETIDGPTPMFVFEAPTPGTGKSLLMDVLCFVLLRDARLRLPALSDDDELRKKLTSALAAGEALISWDNVEEMRLPALKEVLTGPIWTDRLLGVTEHRTWPIRAVFCASTNNPAFDHEMLRRCVSIRLDAGVEKPHLRSGFYHHPIQEYVRQARPELLGAFLTLARAGGTSIDPQAPILGSYEAWSRRISAILKRGGVKGFLARREEAEEQQLTLADSALAEFFTAWRRCWGAAWVRLADLLPIAREIEGLWLGKSDNERSQLPVLGRTLQRHRDAIIGGLRLRIQTRIGHGNLFQVSSLEPRQADQDAQEDNPEPPF